MSAQPLLELEDLGRKYISGDTQIAALDGVTLRIWPGEFVAIMGQSGSGKSTLMNIIGCLDRPDSGRYLIRGQNVAALTNDELAALRRETFGFIFQRYNLLANSNAEENVEVPAIYSGLHREARKQRARELLATLGLKDRTSHTPSELSGGQQQRVAVARALMNEPAVILADEPTGALDTTSGTEVLNLLKELHREGHCLILITHDEKVAAHADRVVRIEDGRIIQDPGPAKQNPSVASLNKKRKPNPSWASSTMEAIRISLRALRCNLFRTALTLLGIVIGVAAVIIMLAVGNGSKQSVLDGIQRMGTNIVFVRPGASGMRSSGDIATLTMADAAALSEIENIQVVVPERSGQKTLRFESQDYAASVEGVGSDFPVARDWPLAKGSFFSERDIASYAPVVVLGKTVVDALFDSHVDPVGKYVIVGTIPFEVIGVLVEKGAAPWGGDQDNTALIPISTALVRLYGGNYLRSITLKVYDTTTIDKTEAAVQQILLARHGTEDFQVRNSSSFIDMASESQNTLTVLLGTVAAISLLVGGIGVMNIMLVSVTERTKEIGIRMATGARIKDIMFQFNTEAAVVCTLGGIIGLILGYAGGLFLRFFEINILFTATPALLAFCCAVGTGLFFGHMPARKAAYLDPVKALATE